MTTVAWLHGYTMDSRMWEELWALLPSYRHVGVDLPLHGGARDTPMPGSLPELARSVADQVRTCGARILVGLSFGSAVALQVELDHPDLLDTLVLAAPTLAGQPDDPAARAKYRFLIRECFLGGGDPETRVRLWMSAPPAIFSGLRRHPERFRRLQQIIVQHEFAELRDGSMQGLQRTAHSPAELRRITSRLLVLSGSEDMPQFRSNAALLEQTVPRSTVVTMPGLGHLPLLEDPVRCAPVLDGFLTSAGSGVSPAA